MNPESTIASFKQWGLRLHISEIITASKETLFDGPGDFQLCLRSQLFQMHGLNEQMVLGWHVDSNLCKRMWLLNGETKSVLDQLHAFHCDHTRIQSVYHMAGTSTENSFADFFVNVTSPDLPEQKLSWGLPDENIEEIALDKKHTTRLSTALMQIIPGMSVPIAGQTTVDGFDTGLYYDNFHVFPYLAESIVNLPLNSHIGYFGNNPNMLSLLSELRMLLGHSGMLMYDEDLLTSGLPAVSCKPSLAEEIHVAATTFIIDMSMKNLPFRFNKSGLPIPDKSPQVFEYARKMSEVILGVARCEKYMVENNAHLRTVIFIGCHNTSFDLTIMALFSCAMTPVSTHIRSGVLSPAAFHTPPPIIPLHFYAIGAGLHDKVVWISDNRHMPVTAYEVQVAESYFKMFAEVSDKKAALDALETLLSFEAGRGLLEMQIEIARINGVLEQGKMLHNLIKEYEKRPYR
ncbi:MAG: hypothetical protein WCP10_01865 [Desulfuromonadales bacterium]